MKIKRKGRVLTYSLTDSEKYFAWSMLMNLNGEAERYKGEKNYDNSDKTIAKRLDLKVEAVRVYLAKRAEQHLKKINKRVNKNYNGNSNI